MGNAHWPLSLSSLEKQCQSRGGESSQDAVPIPRERENLSVAVDAPSLVSHMPLEPGGSEGLPVRLRNEGERSSSSLTVVFRYPVPICILEALCKSAHMYL